jgi:glycosyltransferase involved in cell wall biosynthesis
MRLLLISFSFNKGGAAIAAQKFAGIATTFKDIKVEKLSQDQAGKFQFLKRLISFALVKLQFYGNPIKHSLNLFSYAPVVESFKIQTESIHHLHWINNDTLSVFDFDKIPSGSLVTLHDEWFYCGAEHCYKALDNTDDFISGYTFFKEGVYGLHWNFMIWRVKKNKLSYRNDLIYTVPSKWMLERAKSSLILKKADVRYLPNPIDTDTFKPMGQEAIEVFKERHSIGDMDITLCFSAIGGKKNYLKGAHLLDKALNMLKSRLSIDLAKKIKLIDFGGEIKEGRLQGFSSISVGYVRDPCQLALLYSAVDCVVVPSMVESFGQVAAESLACGTPVVCFDTSGLRDIVLHKKTGMVAKAFEVESLADQLLEVIEMSNQARQEMGIGGREHVSVHFSYPVVSEQYLKILRCATQIKKSMSV